MLCWQLNGAATKVPFGWDAPGAAQRVTGSQAEEPVVGVKKLFSLKNYVLKMRKEG